jgi:hypothetical protein
MTDIPEGTSIFRKIPLDETKVTTGIKNPLDLVWVAWLRALV